MSRRKHFRRHDEALRLRQNGLRNSQIAEALGVRPVTVWRAIGAEEGRRAGRANTVRKALDTPLSERKLRELAAQIDGVYYAPARADVDLPPLLAPAPCVRCGVRYEAHKAQGCRKYTAL